MKLSIARCIFLLGFVGQSLGCLRPPPPVNDLQSSHPVSAFESQIAEAAARMERDVDADGFSARVRWVGVERPDYAIEPDALGQPARMVVAVHYVFELRKNGQDLGKCYLGGNSTGYAELWRAHLGGGRYGAATLTPTSPLAGIDDNVAHRLQIAVDCSAIAKAKGGWHASAAEPSQAESAGGGGSAQSSSSSLEGGSGAGPSRKVIDRRVKSYNR